MKRPIPLPPQPRPPRYLLKAICMAGFALHGYALPSHAALPQAAGSHPLANRLEQNRSQPLKVSQAAKKDKPSSKKRVRSPRSARLIETLENLFIPPKGAAPKSTANSATRSHGKCHENEAAIRAIMPAQGYGLSASDRPAITLDLPATSAQSVALLFQPESGQADQRVRLAIPQPSPRQSGPDGASLNLTPFQLPADQPGLEAGQRYRWSLVVICGETIEPDDPTFMGWVKYQAPTPQEQQALSQLSPQEQQRWYGERGYWYDMLKP